MSDIPRCVCDITLQVGSTRTGNTPGSPYYTSIKHLVSNVKSHISKVKGIGKRATYLRVTAQVRIPSLGPGGIFVQLPLDIVSEDDLSNTGRGDETSGYRFGLRQSSRQRHAAERGAGHECNNICTEKCKLGE